MRPEVPSGWAYFKRGHCPDCDDADSGLYVATLPNEKCHIGGYFPPVCLGCAKKYSLDVICSVHRTPIRVTDARCKLCHK